MKIPESLHYDGKNHSVKKLKSWLDNTKYKIVDERTINDLSSPTGKTYIGISKKPLTKVKDGFGFYGVLAQTDNRQFVQCHVCGKWFRKITAQHTKFHHLQFLDYKKKFGILKGTAMIPDAVSYELEEKSRAWMAKWLKDPKNKDKYAKRLERARNKIRAINKHNRYPSEAAETIEYQNRYAACEKQLGYRLLEYIKKYKYLPTGTIKGEGEKIRKVLARRYGSRNLGFKHYKLPTLTKMGPNIELISHDGKQLRFNMFKQYNRDEVYNWIVKNSPLLN